MTLKRYISVLSRSKHLGIDIGFKGRSILMEFAQRPVLSAYQVHSMYKRGEISDQPMAYKNALMHVRKLESLGFIKPVNQKYTKHGAIYYRISEEGMFQFFLRHSGLPFGLSSILDNHGNYSIFETLLYPCFKKETLAAIAVTPATTKVIDTRIGRARRLEFGGVSFGVTKLILEYLMDCCKWIKGELFAFELAGAEPNLEEIHSGIALSTDVLVMKILLSFRQPVEKEQMNALSILAQDEKFKNIAQDLQKDFKRSFDFAMQLRARS